MSVNVNPALLGLLNYADRMKGKKRWMLRCRYCCRS